MSGRSSITESGLTYRDVIPKTNPAAQALDESFSSKPRFPFALGDAPLEQRPCEKNGSQEQAAKDFEGPNGPHSQQLEDLCDCCIAFLRGDGQDNQGADQAGNADRPNPGPNDRRRISTQSGRWPGR